LGFFYSHIKLGIDKPMAMTCWLSQKLKKYIFNDLVMTRNKLKFFTQFDAISINPENCLKILKKLIFFISSRNNGRINVPDRENQTADLLENE